MGVYYPHVPNISTQKKETGKSPRIFSEVKGKNRPEVAPAPQAQRPGQAHSLDVKKEKKSRPENHRANLEKREFFKFRQLVLQVFTAKKVRFPDFFHRPQKYFQKSSRKKRSSPPGIPRARALPGQSASGACRRFYF